MKFWKFILVFIASLCIFFSVSNRCNREKEDLCVISSVRDKSEDNRSISKFNNLCPLTETAVTFSAKTSGFLEFFKNNSRKANNLKSQNGFSPILRKGRLTCVICYKDYRDGSSGFPSDLYADKAFIFLRILRL